MMLSKILGIKYPIIQAPMAGGITTPELVSAVSNAGALGSLGAAYMAPDALKHTIKQIKAHTNKPFQANLFVPDRSTHYDPHHYTDALNKLDVIYNNYGLERDDNEYHLTAFEKQVEIVLAEKIPVISFTFGIPDPAILQSVKESGAILIGHATCMDEARQLEAAGFHIIVAQGYEAGGHRATFHTTLERNIKPDIGLFALLQHCIAALKIPIIASGGIVDGRGIAACMMLGAGGAQLGTAFLQCLEANVTQSWRDAMMASPDTGTSITDVFSGRLARGLSNKFMQEMNAQIPPFPWQHYLTTPLRAEAKRRDDSSYQALWAGQCASLTRRMTAQELVDTLVAEMRQTNTKQPFL